MTAPLADISEASGNLLAPEPAVRTGALIGYARISISGQLLDRQQHALAEAGCLRVFAGKLSGKNADRPELAACLDYLRPGDTLVVPSLDRLSRSLADLIQIVTTLRVQGVGFKSLHEALDATTPAAGRSPTSSPRSPSSSGTSSANALRTAWPPHPLAGAAAAKAKAHRYTSPAGPPAL